MKSSEWKSRCDVCRLSRYKYIYCTYIHNLHKINEKWNSTPISKPIISFFYFISKPNVCHIPRFCCISSYLSIVCWNFFFQIKNCAAYYVYCHSSLETLLMDWAEQASKRQKKLAETWQHLFWDLFAVLHVIYFTAQPLFDLVLI